MKLPPLDANEFPAFFNALHSQPPFLWQERLAYEVARDGRWRSLIDAPTGSGKTAVIDIAVFHLALEATSEPRLAPIRVAFVVDRRIIADAAYDRARHIARRLEDALRAGDSTDVLWKVARRLSHLSDGGPPLLARLLRGGVPQENDWARTPSQPTVLCSTVDQVGSRLLFRGYGISDSMKPVHAGLIGADCLLLLDEAHLSEPFRQTLDAIKTFRRPPWLDREFAPWAHVTLSATPGVSNTDRFTLTGEERNEERLAARLNAKKLTKLIKCNSRSTEPAAHAKELVEEAINRSGIRAKEAAPRLVAIVVNRVALARRCHEVLCERLKDCSAPSEAILLIGRTRETDRERLLGRYKASLASNRKNLDRTIFVVATQCIEAGADFDFDVLVTQIAPLDALRQRFGRLNRMGRPIEAKGAVMACPDEISSRADDPLYGDRAKETWDELKKRSTNDHIDFGFAAMDCLLERADVENLVTEKRKGPTVMPAYLDLWAQTHPIPNADPEPALFLHGVSDAADVQIVWRADVARSDLRRDAPEEARERVLTLLKLMPPRAAEALAVPIKVARAWLAGQMPPAVSDTEGSTADPESGTVERMIPAFRWRGPESDESRSIRPQELMPGDTIVVSSTEGGCDEYGWAPNDRELVSDTADLAAAPYARRRFAFRVHRSTLENDLYMEGRLQTEDDKTAAYRLWRRIQRIVEAARDEPDGTEVARSLSEADGLPAAWIRSLKALADSKPVIIHFPYDDEASEQTSGLVFVAPKGVSTETEETEEIFESSTESDDVGSFKDQPIELSDHAQHVKSKAECFATSLRLPAHLREDVTLAAFLHDEGKRDERFQLYLRHGDRLRLMIDKKVLAKSGKPMPRKSADARIRRLSGLPPRWRHEASSVTWALEHPRFKEARDPELVLWLIGTHHGYGRPLFPHGDPGRPGPHNLDFEFRGKDWPQIFLGLLRKYGPWTLAHLEAIVRLADHRASDEEQREPEEQKARREPEEVVS